MTPHEIPSEIFKGRVFFVVVVILELQKLTLKLNPNFCKAEYNDGRILKRIQIPLNMLNINY